MLQDYKVKIYEYNIIHFIKEYLYSDGFTVFLLLTLNRSLILFGLPIVDFQQKTTGWVLTVSC